jgi:predicted GNAT family acetyltransferase
MSHDPLAAAGVLAQKMHAELLKASDPSEVQHAMEQLGDIVDRHTNSVGLMALARVMAHLVHSSKVSHELLLVCAMEEARLLCESLDEGG